MESLKLYETSLNEIKAIEKKMAFDQVTINMYKLDGKTKEELTNSISSVLANRKEAIIDTIQGVKWKWVIIPAKHMMDLR